MRPNTGILRTTPRAARPRLERRALGISTEDETQVTLTKEQALSFAQDWVEAWNAHDLDRVLAHYTDDVQMSSPFIVAFIGDPSGTLNGKPAVRAYWQTALTRIPDLHFELLGVFTCVNSLVIHYKAVLGTLATEVLFLGDDGRVCKALAHYDR
jgi:hypothetical protein